MYIDLFYNVIIVAFHLRPFKSLCHSAKKKTFILHMFAAISTDSLDIRRRVNNIHIIQYLFMVSPG